MSDVLDLTVHLTPPPKGAPPGSLAAVTIRCDVLGAAGSGGILTDPLTAEDREDLLWYLEQYPVWPYDDQLERARAIEGRLAEVGHRLFEAALGPGFARIVKPWQLHAGPRHQLSVIAEVSEVLALPWELLHDGQGFLSLRTRDPVSVVRRLPQSDLAALPVPFEPPFEPPLRVLLVTARPEGTDLVDPRGVACELLDELGGPTGGGGVSVELLRPPTLGNLRGRLADSVLPPVQVVHFDGHGTFDMGEDGRGQGRLAFEDDDGRLNAVPADVLAQVLQGSGVRLAVLTACRSAVGTADPFSSIAAQLIRSGLDAVVAMGASLLAAGAVRYSEGFYRAIAGGSPVPVAQDRARQAMFDNPRRHLQRRRPDDPGTPVILRDWWLPQLYQQRPLDLCPAAKKGKRAGAHEPPPDDAPRYGFVGRAAELHHIERHLTRGRLVYIHGPAGSGKSAVAREAAGWLVRTGFCAAACPVSFGQGGDAASLIRALAGALQAVDRKLDPDDPPAALERLSKAMTKRPVLVVADDLEGLATGGLVPADPATRAGLWDTLLELPRLGCGALLVGRDRSLGDARLAPGRRTAHLPVAGLDPPDALALADRILGDMAIDRSRIPFRELQALLSRLGHSPLAIQLVLPMVRDVHWAKLQVTLDGLLQSADVAVAAALSRELTAALRLWVDASPRPRGPG